MKATNSATGESPFCAIGVDVGGTKISAGLGTFPKGEVSERVIGAAAAAGRKFS